jgi:hypothetical protein
MDIPSDAASLPRVSQMTMSPGSVNTSGLPKLLEMLFPNWLEIA